MQIGIIYGLSKRLKNNITVFTQIGSLGLYNDSKIMEQFR